MREGPTVLDDIVASVRSRLPEVVASEDRWREDASGLLPARDFAAALTVQGLSIIAEVKRRSPSAGSIADGLDPAIQASRYVSGGAAAISVLTEPDHFGGSLADLVAVREAVDVPVLRKDFVVHPAQVWQARAAGADAVLLIVAILGDAELVDLLETTDAAGLAALVEVHDVHEVDRAVAAGATIIGVNNRDLRTFQTDLATAERIAPRLAGVAVSVAESGIADPAGAARMAACGFDAVLVGEALVRSVDPAGMVAALRRAAP